MGEPVFLALLTADRIITEKNDKKGIIGTFNRLAAPKFPARFPPWWVYASATNLSGEHSFALEVVSDDDSSTLFSAKGKLQIESPSQIIEITIPVAACTFKAPGKYTVLFHLDEMPLGARILHVDTVELPAGREPAQ